MLLSLLAPQLLEFRPDPLVLLPPARVPISALRRDQTARPRQFFPDGGRFLVEKLKGDAALSRKTGLCVQLADAKPVLPIPNILLFDLER